MEARLGPTSNKMSPFNVKEMSFPRRNAGYSLSDHKRNEKITVELQQISITTHLELLNTPASACKQNGTL